jgi:biopolymer transport protein ExbB/TolQ
MGLLSKKSEKGSEGSMVDMDTALFAEAGKSYTNVSVLPSIIIGLLGAISTVGLSLALKNSLPYFYALINERSFVQYITTYAFWFSMGLVFFKFMNLRKEIGAFGLAYIKEFTKGRDILGKDSFVGELHRIEENMNPREGGLLLVRRINKAIKQLRISNSAAEVADVLSKVSKTDSDIIDSSYVLIKFMVWFIPILGFAATILGMAQAIGSFDSILRNINEVGLKGVQQNLGAVTSGLGIAFDATFLALFLSAILNFFINILQKREEDFLSDVENFTTDNIVNKLSSLKMQMMAAGDLAEPHGYDPMVDFKRNLENLKDAVVTNLSEVSRDLKNLHKLNQYNGEGLAQQVGRIVEAIREAPELHRKKGEETNGTSLEEALRSLNEAAHVLREGVLAVEGVRLAGANLERYIQTAEQLMQHLQTKGRDGADLAGPLGELLVAVKCLPEQLAPHGTGGNGHMALAGIENNLETLGQAIKENAETMRRLENLEGYLEHNTAVLGKITDSLNELVRVNIALGNLFAGIYNKEFKVLEGEHHGPGKERA